MAEKQVNNIPVEKFRSGTDHFDSWIGLFEKAINLAYKGAEDADITDARTQWLPLKLDDKARLIYAGVTGATWPVIKANLKKALIDPQEEYLWHARVATITWDGVESFHSLSTRIIQAVDMYHTENRENEYFFRFRLALPPDYRRAIDLGCSKENRTIKNAIDIAERLRVADADTSGAGATAAATPKAVSFSGAAMNDDRLKSLELAMEGVTIRLDNMDADKKKKPDDEPRSRRDEARSDYNSRDRRSPSRDSRYDRHDSYERRRRDESRDGRRPRYDSRERYRAYDNSPYRGRSRRDSYDRRDSRDRYRRDYYSRDRFNRDSLDRRNFDRRDRYRSPSDSRGYQYNRDRYDSRDRDRYDGSQRDGWGRRNSWDRGSNRGDASQTRNQRWDNRSPRGDHTRPEHRLAEFNDVDWLCAAISEKRDRDRNTQEN